MSILFTVMAVIIGFVFGLFSLLHIVLHLRARRELTTIFSTYDILSIPTVKTITNARNINIAIHAILFSVVTVLIITKTAPIYILWYGIGVALAVLVGYRKTGMCDTNTFDYIIKYSPYMGIEDKLKLANYFKNEEVNKILGVQIPTETDVREKAQ